MKLTEIWSLEVSLIFRIAQIIQRTIIDLKEEALNFEREGINFDKFKEMIGFNAWSKLKELFSSND
tara:strand:- start:108 stop:305 length:198 start_codon:yes stop_codon:yes gene_type:complete